MKRDTVISLLSLSVALIVVGLIALGILSILRSMVPEKTKAEPSLAAGYPAGEDEVEAGKFYCCKASIVDTSPNYTNLFLVLQEMRPNGDKWQAIGTNRLFQIEIEHHMYIGEIYEASRKGTNLSLKKAGDW